MAQNELHIAVKQAIFDLGKKAIKEDTFYGVLLDYNAYPQNPIVSSNLKSVMKDILNEGYGRKVYYWSTHPSVGWKTLNDKFIDGFIRKTQHDSASVNTISEALLYGIGLINDITITWQNINVTSENPDSLSKLKDAYLKLLINSITIEEDSSGLQSAYYIPESNAELFALEEKIRNAYEILSSKYDNWCDIKKNSFLKKVQQDIDSKNAIIKNKLRKQKRRRNRRIILAVLIGFVVLVIVISNHEYKKAKPYIATFESSIALGDSAAEQHDYLSALNYYQQAADNYTCIWATDQYREEAMQKRLELILGLCDKCVQKSKDYLLNRTLPSPSDCYMVKKLLDSIPSDDILTNEETEAKNARLVEVDSILNDGIEKNILELLNGISSNRGERTTAILSKIDTLLLCDKDNYWLHIIKEKK